MKKMLIVACVVALGFLVFGAANGQFGNIKVPGVGNVTGDVAQIEYDQCKNYINQYDNNVDWNTKNLFGKFESNKDIKLVKCTKDYAKSDSKWDRENLAMDKEYNYRNFATITARCTKEKCNIYCNRK